MVGRSQQPAGRRHSAVPPRPQPYGLAMKKRRRKLPVWAIVGIVLAKLLLIIGGVLLWYYLALRPVSDTPREARVIIEDGRSVHDVAEQLRSAELIRSKTAFQVYAHLQPGNILAGTYVLSPHMSASEIFQLLSGERQPEEQMLTIIPGTTIFEVRESLRSLGYSDQDITAAFEHDYDHPLLAHKPSGVSLEGYLFPETYNIDSQAPLTNLFERIFDEYYNRLAAEGLEERLDVKGLNLHEGITLASIIEKEVAHIEDKRQVAQIFLKRLQDNMRIDSDVTFEYAARLLDVEPYWELESPYNTRVVFGLPPGAIANPSLETLQAVANPAPGDYVFFLTGDDGTMHYTYTLEEHNAAIERYCQVGCR